MKAQEPFCYFRSTPFGWEDCAESDEGAKALYEHPRAPEGTSMPPCTCHPGNDCASAASCALLGALSLETT